MSPGKTVAGKARRLTVLALLAAAGGLLHTPPHPTRGAIRPAIAASRERVRLARDLHPGKRNSLDALCARYGVAPTMLSMSATSAP